MRITSLHLWINRPIKKIKEFLQVSWRHLLLFTIAFTMHSQLSIHKVHEICFTSHKSAWFQTLYFLFQNPLFMSSSQQSFGQLYTDIIVELLNIYTAMFSTIVLYLISINCRYLLVGTVWLVKTLADKFWSHTLMWG